MHKKGLTVDSIVGLQCVTADGKVHECNEKENTELFWGLRGAAGVLGVVTRIDLQAYPMEMCFGGLWAVVDDAKGSKAKAAMKMARDIMLAEEKSGQRSVFGAVFTTHAPPAPAAPPVAAGKPIAMMMLATWKSGAEAKKLLEPFLALGDIALGAPPAQMPYPVFSNLLMPLINQMPSFRGYWTGIFADKAEQACDKALDSLVDDWIARPPFMAPGFVALELHGGAEGREFGEGRHRVQAKNDVPVKGLRNFLFSVGLLGYQAGGKDCDGPTKEHVKKAQANFWAASGAAGQAGQDYVNYHNDFPEQDTDGTLLKLYGSPETVARLRALKKSVDPDNVFTRSTIPL